MDQYATGTFSRVVAFRLAPGEDVLKSIESICIKNQIKNGVIVSGIGSLGKVVFTNPELLSTGKIGYGDFLTREGYLEVVSMSGIICHDPDGTLTPHIHISLTVGAGDAFGGHLQYGSTVLLTTDILIAEVDGIDMLRSFDPQLGVPIFSPRQAHSKA